MKYWGVIFTFLILAIISPAHASIKAIPTFQLMAGKDPPSIAPFVRYSKNIDGPDGISTGEIRAAPLDRIQGQSIHFGAPGVKTAVFLKVKNIGTAQGSWILTTGRGTLNYFRLYEVSDNQTKLLVDGSDAQSARDNLSTYQAFSAELVLDQAQEKLILVEFLSENSTYMPLKISTYGTFFKERRANIAMVSGVVFGAIVLLLLNFLFFSITGHREFIWLAVAEGFFASNTIHAEGYFTIFFLSDKPMVGLAIETIFKCGFAGAMAQFGRSFVKTPVNFPKSDVALKVLIGAAVTLMILQAGLTYYPANVRHALLLGGWLVTIGVAFYLPFVGYAAMKQLGFQLWPLFVGWASLAFFITYAAIASMGIFTWIPINWHLAGPVGLFESIMVTLALGLNLKKIQNDKLKADTNYANSLSDKLEISKRAALLAEEKAFALATVNSQNALLHASGHDSKQVILALNSAIDVLKQQDSEGRNGDLTDMLQSSADYLNEIISTTISGANIAGSDADFIALSSFKGNALIEPLMMMFKTPFADKKLTLKINVIDDVFIISDKPLLMRALANLLSNSYKYTKSGGAAVSLVRVHNSAVITVSDTGIGMSTDIVEALNGDGATRLRANEEMPGAGSGFKSAKRLINNLSATLQIINSTPTGTDIQISLPCAAQSFTPCSAADLQGHLAHFEVLDFDDRSSFELALSERLREKIAAITYDDTTITRGRLSELVGVMMVKPLCREMASHPFFSISSEKI